VKTRSVARVATAMMAALSLASCTVPRLGPNISEINNAGTETGETIPVVPITRSVAALTDVPQVNSIPGGFSSEAAFNVDRIRPGDLLAISVYENLPDGLLAQRGAPAQIAEITVEPDGTVFLPFAGVIRAAGRSPAALREEIFQALDDQTPDPQVIVRHQQGTFAEFSIAGDIGAQGSLLIESNGMTLTRALSNAGGITSTMDRTRITVFRDGQQARVWADDLFEGRTTDFFIHPGDRILVDEVSRQFVALGAIGSQTAIEFESSETSLIDAVGIIGGLNTAASNPAGVFVFRSETPEIFANVSGVTGQQVNDIIYSLDMRDVESVFAARNFQVRDGDFIYIAETPITQFSRILSLFTSNIGAAGSLSGS